MHNIEEINEDWYEYVEYGTTNEKNIFLQRCGFTRDSAEYIKGKGNKYIEKINNEFKIHKSLGQCDDESVASEFNDLLVNLVDVLID